MRYFMATIIPENVEEFKGGHGIINFPAPNPLGIKTGNY